MQNTALTIAAAGLTLHAAKVDREFWARLVDFVLRAGRAISAIGVKSGDVIAIENCLARPAAY